MAWQEGPNEDKGVLVLVLVDTKKVFAFPIRNSDPPRFRGANATERSGRLKASITVKASARNRMLIMVIRLLRTKKMRSITVDKIRIRITTPISVYMTDVSVCQSRPSKLKSQISNLQKDQFKSR
jgi:hypothetical protein